MLNEPDSLVKPENDTAGKFCGKTAGNLQVQSLFILIYRAT